MKVVLSREGFDSENGGMPSAVMPNGEVVSFPIPSCGDRLCYLDLKNGGRVNENAYFAIAIAVEK